MDEWTTRNPLEVTFGPFIFRSKNPTNWFSIRIVTV